MTAVTSSETATDIASAVPMPSGRIHVIRPWRPGVLPRIVEVWAYRRLLPYFGKQYLLRRVRNTWLGWIWIPLRPGIDILSKALFFGGVLGAQSGDRPYVIFFTFGSCGWIVFERVNMWATRSMRMSAAFFKKAYSPRLPRLVAVLIPAALDFFLYVLVAIGAVFYYLITRGILYVHPSFQLLTAVLGIILLALWGLTLGLFTAPWSAYTRDVRFSFGYVTQFWYFVTPIAYPISQLPPAWQPIAELNPITAPIEMVKDGFLDTGAPTFASLVSCFAGLGVLGLLGLWSFSRFERAAVARL